MSIVKSSSSNLTLNADGSGNDVLIQSNGSTKAIVTAESKLGIGIGSPTADLHIHNSADHTRLNIDCSNSSGDNWQFQSRNNGEFWLRNDDNSRNDIVVYPSTGYVAAKNGLLFGTDTAAANALDDYEEGTWTPTIVFGSAAAGVNYSIQSGFYTKVGNLVNAMCYLTLSNKGTSVGAASVEGLPFTSANITGAYASVSIGRISSISFADTMTGLNSIGTTYISLRESTNAGVLTNITNANFANSGSVMATIAYRV